MLREKLLLASLHLASKCLEICPNFCKSFKSDFRGRERSKHDNNLGKKYEMRV